MSDRGCRQAAMKDQVMETRVCIQKMSGTIKKNNNNLSEVAQYF